METTEYSYARTSQQQRCYSIPTGCNMLRAAVFLSVWMLAKEGSRLGGNAQL